jgi:hypothetical protein
MEDGRKRNVNIRIDFGDVFRRREWKWLGITFDGTV